jgi:hypothetical protein
MELGFARTDITPRVGVELCGFGPFLNRHSVGIRDRLWARAMAVRVGEQRAVVIACDLIGVAWQTTKRVRAMISESCGLAPDEVMVCCSHTHSGPAPGIYIGWGEADPLYLETLPHRIAQAAIAALGRLQSAELAHAEAPCEGIAINREYDQFWAPYEAAMQPDWRPPKPELTDTTCHVLTARGSDGGLLGFAAYFGCHPVVCCENCRGIHGDYPGIAMNAIERDHPGAVGLFLQGAQGDVNTAIGGRSEKESLLALDEIAGRFARAVRDGIRAARAVSVDRLATGRREVVFTRKPWDREEIARRLAECEQQIAAPGPGGVPTDEDRDRRMQMVYVTALRRLLAQCDRGEALAPATEIHGLRLGPIALLGSPFETFRAIKTEVCAQVAAPIPLVVSFTNDSVGYAVDTTTAARGGYAADMVPLIRGELPFANIHAELVRELRELDRMLIPSQ